MPTKIQITERSCEAEASVIGYLDSQLPAGVVERYFDHWKYLCL